MITPGPVRNVAPAPTANPIAIRSRFHERLGASVNLARALSIRYAPRPPMIQAAGPTRASTNSRGSTVMQGRRNDTARAEDDPLGGDVDARSGETATPHRSKSKQAQRAR